MTQNTHRILTMLAAFVAGAGGVIVVTDPATLGVSPGTWEIIGGWSAFLGGLSSMFVTSLRQFGTPPQ